MLTPHDDYPIHQTSLPVAHPASGDPNHYDRYFFNGFDSEGGWYLGVAMGLYPNRRIIDAAFSVVRDGEQRSVFGSGRAPADPAHTAVGPIAIEVVEPLRVTRVRVDAPHLGIEAELEFVARTMAVEEPRQTMMDGHVTVLDATRLVQWGTWRGWFAVDGVRTEVSPPSALGTKDRSWGTRPVGDPAGAAPGAGMVGGGLFMFWSPVHFDDRCTHLVLFEDPSGRRSYLCSFAVPVLRDGDAVWGDESAVRHARAVDYTIDYRPGARRSRAATMRYTYADGADELRLEPMLDFQMKGLGYFHPVWRHGAWHGEHAEGSDAWRVADLDPLDLANVHVQQLCRVRTASGERGVGVLEQLIIGPHAPTGLRDFLDGPG